MSFNNFSILFGKLQREKKRFIRTKDFRETNLQGSGVFLPKKLSIRANTIVVAFAFVHMICFKEI